MDKLKSIGGTVGGLLLLLAMLSVPVILLFGIASFSVWALEWIPATIGIAFIICLVLLPVSLIPAARGWTSFAYEIAGLTFTLCLWLYCLAYTYVEWGMVAVVLGVLIFGVGVIFTALLAALLSATWGVMGNIALLIALVFGSKVIASVLSASAAKRAFLKHAAERPSEVVLTHKPSD